MNAPGIVMYFKYWGEDTRRLMTHAEIGELFLGVMDYAQTGAQPKLSTASQRAYFGVMRGEIDHAIESYAKGRTRTEYASYCKFSRRHGEKPMSFEEWQRES